MNSMGVKELIKLSVHRVLNSSRASFPSTASQIHDLVLNPLSLGWLDANIFLTTFLLFWQWECLSIHLLLEMK